MNDKREYEEEDVIDLGELFFAVLKKWWLLLICGLAGGIVACAISQFLIVPKYESTAMLYVLSKTTSVTSLTDLQLGDALAEDFTVIAKSNPVIDQAIEQIKEKSGKTFTREEIQEMISVNNQATRILVIKATSTSAEDASIVANSVADATKDQMSEITKSDPPTTVEAAEIAKEPVSPNVLKNTAIGVAVGLILVILIITIQTLLNDNIKTTDDVENYLGLTTLVVIPDFGSKKREKAEKKKRK